MRVVMRAEVTQPSIELSEELVDFGEVTCGQCKIVSVQLYNNSAVKSEWFFVPPAATANKADKVRISQGSTASIKLRN